MATTETTTTTTTKKKKKNRRWLWIILGLTAVLIIASIIKSKNTQKKTYVETDKSSINSIEEYISASGKIYPEKEVIISSDVSGEITKLLVAEGDSVTTGQLIAQIDPESYLSVVEQGQAALNNVLAQVENAKANVATSEARRDQALANQEMQKLAYDRNKKLFDDGIISSSEFENVQNAWNNSLAETKAAQLAVDAAKSSLKAANYTVESQKASLKEINTNLRRTKIYAPNSGIITRLAVEEGERVVGTAQMAGTEMMRVSDLAEIEVQVEVSENDIPKVTVNDPVKIEVDAYYGKTFEGFVSEVSNSSNNLSQAAATEQVSNFIVKVKIKKESYQDLISPENQYPFRTGMSATVDIITDVRNDVVTVPVQAVTLREIDEEDVQLVLLFTNDTVTYQPVSIGIQDDENIEITEGIDTGQVVIIGPYSAISKDLKQGEEVHLEGEDGKKGKKKKK